MERTRRTGPDRMHPTCPSTQLPFQVGGKWTGMVIVCLADRPRRFTELRELLRAVTPKVLSETLRGMQRDGLITRHDLETNPPHVEYSLTPLGLSLLELIDAARSWAEAHLDKLVAARESGIGTSDDSPR
jgi:DNA-binding HxlR family transcriptional regulator